MGVPMEREDYLMSVLDTSKHRYWYSRSTLWPMHDIYRLEIIIFRIRHVIVPPISLCASNDIIRQEHHGSFVVHPLDQLSVARILNDKHKTHFFCALKVSFSE